MADRFDFFTNKEISNDEFACLMGAVGFGSKNDYDSQQIRNSIDSYSFVAHIRNNNGLLIGYISAFSDKAFSTFIGELVVHPSYQSIGLEAELMTLVEKEFQGVPIYAKPFSSEKDTFLEQGYAEPKRPMIVMTKKNNF